MTTKVEQCPTCGSNAICRSEFWEPAPNEQLLKIEKAIKKYYLALDNREHGGVAKSKAFEEIEAALGMHWEQGKMAEFLEQHPRLKPFYK